ncbi:MAG: hypothetical protein OJJ54_13500 [Pseudonocardia sp.]|nr:hypothetical protein [Pseudonocardia sp.]
MKRYGLFGKNSQDFLTYGGRILVHDNRAEMEFLFPGCPVRELPQDIPPDQTLPIEHHPDLSSVSFPLRREDFR